MAKKVKSIEDHLIDIKYLLAGILLDRKLSVQEVAKIVGCAKSKISKLYPERKKKTNYKKDVQNGS